MPISMPSSPNLVTSRFGLETNTQSFTSPFTKSTQRVLLGGARWSLSGTLPAMHRSQAAVWQAFFLSLEGSAGTFYGFDPDAKSPRGTGSGTPLVNGSAQTGSSLITDGWAANQTVLRVGDYFTVNSELKMVTANALTNGSGQVTISFKPALRNSPADNAVITIDNPTCIMALVDDLQAMWEVNKNGIYQPKSFSAVEVFL